MKFYCYAATVYKDDDKMFLISGYLEAECKSDAENDIHEQLRGNDTVGTLVILEIPRESMVNHLYSIT